MSRPIELISALEKCDDGFAAARELGQTDRLDFAMSVVSKVATELVDADFVHGGYEAFFAALDAHPDHAVGRFAKAAMSLSDSMRRSVVQRLNVGA